jgi:hypothetical protein
VDPRPRGRRSAVRVPLRHGRVGAPGRGGIDSVIRTNSTRRPPSIVPGDADERDRRPALCATTAARSSRHASTAAVSGSTASSGSRQDHAASMLVAARRLEAGRSVAIYSLPSCSRDSRTLTPSR